MEKATNNNDTGLLQDLLPADITSVFSARLPTDAQLWGIETEMAQKMAEKRYAAGHYPQDGHQSSDFGCWRIIAVSDCCRCGDIEIPKDVSI